MPAGACGRSWMPASAPPLLLGLLVWMFAECFIILGQPGHSRFSPGNLMVHLGLAWAILGLPGYTRLFVGQRGSSTSKPKPYHNHVGGAGPKLRARRGLLSRNALSQRCKHDVCCGRRGCLNFLHVGCCWMCWAVGNRVCEFCARCCLVLPLCLQHDMRHGRCDMHLGAECFANRLRGGEMV